MINEAYYQQILQEIAPSHTTLIAVSKLKSVADIQALYDLGQRDFGENYVQELVEKQPQLPTDIRWHFIGHLQTNKVKYIASFVHAIHSVDSLKLLVEINKQALKHQRTIGCLLQAYVAEEETKFGMDATQCLRFMEQYEAQQSQFSNVVLQGIMGMASFTENENQIADEFEQLSALFQLIKRSYFIGKNNFSMLSMGMSNDYPLAIAKGSTHIRIGSLLFGKRV
jgi:pyridoxal phosphate enzyme (YggS family)